MRVAVASAGTYRHVLSPELEEGSFPRGTKGLCDAPVDIEVTKGSLRYIREMRICPRCLDLWIKHLSSVSSLVGEKAEKRLRTIPKRPLLRLAIRPLEGLAGAFRRRRRIRKSQESNKTDWLHRKL